MKGKKQQIIFIYLLLLFITIECQSTNFCGIGCKDCPNNSQTINKCSSCLKDYDLDQTNNICVYSKCDLNLQFQIDEQQNSDSVGKCLSICNPLYQGNDKQKVCQKLNSCSTSFATENNLLNTLIPVDVFNYLEKYYVVLQRGYLSIYDRQSAFLIKHLHYQDEDISIYNFVGQIFIIRNDNSITIWDIISEQRTIIIQSNDLQLSKNSLLFSVQNQYILVASQIETSISLKILYDYKNKKTISSNSSSMQIKASQYQFVNDYLIQIDPLFINIAKVSILNESLLTTIQSDETHCDSKDLGTFISFISSTQIEIYYAIFNQGIMLVNLKDRKCTVIQKIDKIQKARLFQLNDQQISNHLIILTDKYLIDFDCNLLLAQKEIKQNNQNSIIDFEVGQFSENSYQISILLSSKNLEIYSYDTQSKQFTKNSQQIVRISNVQTIKKISGQTPSNNKISYDEIILSNGEIQIFRKSSNQQLFEDKIIKNYNLQYPTPNSSINQLVLLFIPQLVVTCHKNGDIIFYDVSSGYESELIKRLSFESQICYTIYKFQNNKIVAQMKNKIIFINPYQYTIENELQVSGDNISVLVAVNKDQIVIISDNCIQIFNQEFKSEYKVCNQDFTTNVIKIAFNLDLKLVIQKNTQISIYQIDFSKQVVISFVKSITSASQITYFKAIQTFETDQNKIDHSYVLDEIVYYDSNRNFYIYDFNLSLVHSVLGVALLSVSQAKRTINDKNVYFIIGYTNDANSVVKIHGIVKGVNLSYPFLSFQYSPFLDDPIKIVNDNGNAYYNVKQLLELNFFTVHEEFMLDINRNFTYVYGLDYIVGASQTSQVKKTLGASKNYLAYVGTDTGLIGVLKYTDKRYTTLNSKLALKQEVQDDQIYQVIQSALIGLYFIRTKYKITSYSLFTDDFIEELSPLSSSDPRFTYFKIIEEIEAIICFSSNQLLLSVYGDVNKKYYYQGMSQIKGLIFNNDTKKIYLYGNSLVKLDEKLIVITLISEQSKGLIFVDCKDSKLYIICAISPSQFIILDKTTDSITQTIIVKGFTNQYRLGVDEENQNIFIYDVQVQVYSFQGIFKQTLDFNYNTLNTFALNDDYITFFSKSSKNLNFETIIINQIQNIIQIQYFKFHNIYLLKTLRILHFFFILLKLFLDAKNKILKKNHLSFLKQLILIFQISINNIQINLNIQILIILDIVFIQRQNLNEQSKIDSPSGLNIINYLYIHKLSQIVLFCNNALIAQLFVYTISPISNISKISFQFARNSVGIVVDIVFDEINTYIQYLDDQGNYNINGLFSDYTVYNNFKITEIVDRKEQPLGISYDNKFNNVFIYSKTCVYKINYGITGLKYQFGLKESDTLFASVPITNSQEKQFLLLNSGNMLFRYQNLAIYYEKTFDNVNIKDIRYDQINDILIMGLTDQIWFLKNYQKSIDSNLNIETLQLKQVLIHKFLSNSIYLTFDKKIIHCDIKKGNIAHTINIDANAFLTEYAFNSQGDILFIGFSNGKLLQYNINEEYKETYYVNNQVLNTNNLIKFIQIIEDANNNIYNRLFISNGGQVVKVDFKNKVIKSEQNLNQLVSQDVTLLLIDFKYDKMFSRYIFFYSGEKKAYVWNTVTSLQENYLMLSNDQGNKLGLTSKFIITSCSFQINFYSREKRSILITTIQTNNFLDLIMQYQVINESFIAIFFSSKYEVYLLQGNKNIMIDQKIYTNPRFLDYVYNSQSNFMKIYGLHQTGVFEENYNLSIYSDNTIQKCGNEIKSQDIMLVKKYIQSTSPKSTEINSFDGRTVIAQKDWKNILFLKILGDDFQNIIKFISQSTYSNTQIVLYPLEDANNNLTISSETFLSFSQSDFLLSKYNLIFESAINKILNINFSQQIQNIKWQQIKIQSEQINNVQINFQNLKSILFQNIQISKIEQNQQTFNETQSQNTFISIQNVDLVQFYDIYIQNNKLSLSVPKKLFVFKNVKKVIIIGLTVSDNQDIFSYFDFSLVKSIELSNVNIINNKVSQNIKSQRILQDNSTQDQQIQGVLNFFGCNNILINNLQLTNNSNVSILQSQSKFIQNNQIIILMDDKLKIQNATVESQLNKDLSPLFVIKSSYVSLENLKFISNLGNIMIEDANQVSIQSSRFLKNNAKNGGSIYFKSIQNKIDIKSSLFFENTAVSSGGSLFFENLGNCELLFDDETQITNNKALIGGGLRIVYSDFQTFKIPKKYPFIINIKNNLADLYGNDATTYLQMLKVENLIDQSPEKNYTYQLFNDEKSIPANYLGQYSSYINIKNFQSGSDIHLRIYILDSYNRKLTFSRDLLLNNGYPDDIEEELKNIQIFIENINLNMSQLLGEKILNYHQYNSVSESFELNNLQIQATLNSEQYFVMNSNIYTSIKQKPILIGINFRNCVVGEIVQDISQNIMICKYCISGSYQINDPQELYENNKRQSNQNNSVSTEFEESLKNECKSCPSSAKSCEGQNINLKNGYWRSGNFSDEILSCDSSIGSCRAEDSSSKEGCSEGYIGPLCEECDITGQIWDKPGVRYAQTVQKGLCQTCASLYIQWVTLLVKILCLAVYFYATTKEFLDNFKYTQRCYYLRQMQMLSISKNSIKDYSGFYLSSLLITQPNIMPKELNALSDIIGSSNRQITLGFDCIYSKSFIKNNGKILVQALTQALIPVFFIFLLTLILRILQSFKATKTTKYYYITFFHIHISFFQLEQISYFSKSLTCRSIGSQSLYYLDLQTICNDDQVRQFIYPFAIIILAIWSLLPLFVIYFLMKKQKTLNECKTKYMLGYYYAELKEDKYYWEFVRMYVKILIIYIHILLSTNINSISSYATFIICGFYIIITLQYKPFISSTLSKSEIGCYLMIIIKICLQSLKQDSENLQIFSELCITFIDYTFSIYIFIIVIIFKLNNKSSAFGKTARRILKRIIPFSIFNKIINHSNISFQTYLKWRFIKKNIQNIISFKANQNIVVIQNRQKQESSTMKASSLNQSQKSSQLIQFPISSQNDQLFNSSTENTSPQNRLLSEHYSKKVHKFSLQQKKVSVFSPKNWNEYDQVIEQQKSDQEIDDFENKKLDYYSFTSKPSILTCISTPADQSLTFDLNKLK